MLVIYNAQTGEVLDNSGTNADMPLGPEGDATYVNTDARGIDRASVALLRLHDVDDAELVEQVLANRYHVDPATNSVVIDGPHPTPELTEAQQAAATLVEYRERGWDNLTEAERADIPRLTFLAGG